MKILATAMDNMHHKTTQIIIMDRENVDDARILPAAQAIQQGHIVVFPTETVYGVGCRYDDETAKAKIFALKKRDPSKPLGIYLASVAQIREYAVVSDSAEALARAFLPGPLTLVLPGRSGGKLGFRVPSDEVARRLILLSQTPLAGTSANLSGQESPADGKEAIAAMDGRVDVIVDAGRTALAYPSTVIDLCEDPPVILREGAVPVGRLAEVLRRDVRKAF